MSLKGFDAPICICCDPGLGCSLQVYNSPVFTGNSFNLAWNATAKGWDAWISFGDPMCYVLVTPDAASGRAHVLVRLSGPNMVTVEAHGHTTSNPQVPPWGSLLIHDYTDPPGDPTTFDGGIGTLLPPE